MPQVGIEPTTSRSSVLRSPNWAIEAYESIAVLFLIHNYYHIRSFNERKRGYEFWSQRLYKTDASSLCGTSTQFICTGTGDESPKLTLKVLDITWYKTGADKVQWKRVEWDSSDLNHKMNKYPLQSRSWWNSSPSRLTRHLPLHLTAPCRTLVTLS